MAPADILRQTRKAAGLSVRALAEAADVSASTVHRIEQGKTHPTVEMLDRLVEVAGSRLTVSTTADYTTSLVGLAQEIVTDERNVIRKVAEFVARFRSADLERQFRMIAASPMPAGDERWDAFIASLAEWLAVTTHIETPSWVKKRRPLVDPWWVSSMKSMQAWEYAGTPAAFQNRGVYIHRDSLVNV